jgi:hypothetical protein
LNCFLSLGWIQFVGDTFLLFCFPRRFRVRHLGLLFVFYLWSWPLQDECSDGWFFAVFILLWSICTLCPLLSFVNNL